MDNYIKRKKHEDAIGIHWFKKDLRLNDNPSLNYLNHFDENVCIFILDEVNSSKNWFCWKGLVA